MKEMIKGILDTWILFWGSGYYQYLILLAVLLLLLFFRKRKEARLLITYSVILLVLFFFPLSAGIIQKCIGSDVYWRVLWLLPVTVLLAYTGTALAERAGLKARKGGHKLQGLVLILLIGVIGISGKSIWSEDNYVQVHNYQKVPDEVTQVCNLISDQQEEEEEVCVAADDYLAAYIRVYQPSFYMPYSRAGKGSQHYSSMRLYQELSSPDPDLKRVVKAVRKLGCNYLVFALPSQEKQEYLEGKGYRLIGTVNQYGVFKQEHL